MKPFNFIFMVEVQYKLMGASKRKALVTAGSAVHFDNYVAFIIVERDKMCTDLEVLPEELQYLVS